MVKKHNLRNVREDVDEEREVKPGRSSGSRRPGITQDTIGKSHGLIKELLTRKTAGRHGCAVNGPEWDISTGNKSDRSSENSDESKKSKLFSGSRYGKKGRGIINWA
ncbi:hypothetical protein XENORESO_001775 [Xenotaenia resolanae]|uniref:Uncharacterized protein n=1 Tax=Xenotaenia resolanae TaxID=208358 RepID=A0ABV0W0F9_9TELE